jgi:hypothetical protein
MDVNLIEASEKVNGVVEDLFLSFKKDQIEAVFSRNSINDKSARIKLLQKCMHVLDTSHTNETLSLDDDYNDELEIFLNGKWRMLI